MIEIDRAMTEVPDPLTIDLAPIRERAEKVRTTPALTADWACRRSAGDVPVLLAVLDAVLNQRLPRLAGLAEVASLAGVSRQRAGQLAAHPDFPKPVQRLAMGPVWLEADVSKFLAAPRKPGRKPKDAA